MGKMTNKEILLNNLPYGGRSARERGVNMYAWEIVDAVDANNFDKPMAISQLRKVLLNGAIDWNEYSYGGCSLIYDGDIAERLCTPSQLKKKKGGELQPTRRTTWLDEQTHALYQAFNVVWHEWYKISQVLKALEQE